MLPVGDLNPTRRRPIVTLLLIGANVAVFFALMLPLQGCDLMQFVYRWAAVPQEVLSFQPVDPDVIPDHAFAECIAPIVGEKSIALSIFASMFLHGGLIHLGLNMLFLWIFGTNVEDRLGHLTFLVYYLLGGVVAVFAFAFIHPGGTTPLLGASGAIAAVLGGYLLLFPRAIVHTVVPFPLYLLFFIIPRIRTTAFFVIFAIQDIPAWIVLGTWFLLQVSGADQTMATGVAYEAHIAGFLAGVLLTLLLGDRAAARGRS